MRRLAPLFVVSLLTACSAEEGPRGVPQDFDTGIPIFDAPAKQDSGAMPTDSSMGGDTATIEDTATSDVYYPDVTSKDTAVGDAVVLIEGGPTDVLLDTELPDVVSSDTTPGEIGGGT